MSAEEIHGTGGSGKISPSDRKLFEQEYRQGAELFQKALHDFSTSENMYQKQQFKEVMDKALVVLNEAARGLKREELMNQNKKIADDYLSYKNHPNNQSEKILEDDLDKAKKSIK